LDENWEIWLDGGHNENAASALVKQAAQWQEQDGRPLYIIAAMLDHKDPANFIRPLEPFVKKLYVTTLESEPHMLKIQILKDKLPDAQSAASYRAALQDLQNDTPPGRILICGSLYLAGHVLKDIA
ncbi:MAG: bifunctional folylpolyglutamate synthase/dihydrofolate synthase, partial [Alphaproteobacteria bacterium]|nr:bifunctional folylpolyglutamate synthase/dihydrofolate synthase [Alphaproteobacteria bacterium]